MKIVLFDSSFDSSPSGAETPAFRLFADSAITPPGRPLFLPDILPDWDVEIHLAVKVSRLGKDIAMKFARRYYESFALAVRQVPRAPQPAGVEMLFDNALTFSPWLPVGDYPDAVDVEICGRTVRIEALSDILSRAITAVSRYCTLKTGDILLPLQLGPAIPIEIGSPIAASIDGHPLIGLKIK